jgi:hypothetical protein
MTMVRIGTLERNQLVARWCSWRPDGGRKMDANCRLKERLDRFVLVEI